MSFCPNEDIHSVYLDNELPEEFKAEYEEHLKNCPECQKKLSELKALHSLFAADSKNLNVDSHFLDQSFERLQIKMKYNKTIAKPKVSMENLKKISYGISAVAAAAVFALIIPIRVNNKINTNSDAVAVSVNPIGTTANNVSFDSGRSVVISGNIEQTAVSNRHYRNFQSDNYIRNVSSGNTANMIDEVDVFKPDFEKEAIIYIKVPFAEIGIINKTPYVNGR